MFEAGPPPDELEMVWQIRRWDALPEAGGLLDQPAGLLQRLAFVENMHNAFKMWKDGKAVELANKHPALFDFIVYELGIVEWPTND